MFDPLFSMADRAFFSDFLALLDYERVFLIVIFVQKSVGLCTFLYSFDPDPGSFMAHFG
jgi:hypothetical protein